METRLTFSGRFHYRADKGCALHSHTTDNQIQLILSGTGYMKVDEEGFRVKEGNVILIPRGATHSFTALGNAGMKTLEVKFESDDEELLGSINPHLEDKNGELFKLFSALVLEGQRKKAMYKRLCNAMLQEILVLMARLSLEMDTRENIGKGIDRTENKVIAAVNDYIYANLDKHFSLSDLAAGVGYNQDYLYRTVRKHKGTTLVEYVNRIRFEEAKQLITQSDLTISEISYSLGFESIPYFSRFFKKYAGIAPSEYTDKVRSSIRIDY